MKIERPPSKQPIPPEAKLVFKGVIFDVYQWEQKMFDGSVATFEKLKRADTAVVIPVTPEGKVVLTRQEQPGKAPFLGCAGGRLEEGEDPLEAARRELLEETGYESDDIILWHAIQPTSKLDWAVYTFIARDSKRVMEQKLDAGERIELRLLDFDEFVEIATKDNSFLETEMVIKLLRAKTDPAQMAEAKELFGIRP
jgi:8-oxo-dGTP pyrophosphatase MutT (NUDIX family)